MEGRPGRPGGDRSEQGASDPIGSDAQGQRHTRHDDLQPSPRQRSRPPGLRQPGAMATLPTAPLAHQRSAVCAECTVRPAPSAAMRPRRSGRRPAGNCTSRLSPAIPSRSGQQIPAAAISGDARPDRIEGHRTWTAHRTGLNGNTDMGDSSKSGQSLASGVAESKAPTPSMGTAAVIWAWATVRARPAAAAPAARARHSMPAAKPKRRRRSWGAAHRWAANEEPRAPPATADADRQGGQEFGARA